MIKKWRQIGLIFILIICNFSMGWAEGQLEIIAPGGGEMDLARNIMKYHGSDLQPVEVRWKNSGEDGRNTANSDREYLKGKEQAKNTQRTPVWIVLKSYELTVDLSRDYFVASKSVVLKYDLDTSLTGNFLEWDRKNNFMNLSGKSVVIYKDWVIKGSKVEAQLGKDLFTVYGPAEASNKLNIIRGGKIIFDRMEDKAFIQDDPVLIRGKNEMSASEIIYDLKTNQVSANGAVKTRIIDEVK